MFEIRGVVMGTQMVVNKNELLALEDAAKRASKMDFQNKLCWCHLTVGIPSSHGLHTGYCHNLRNHFGIIDDENDD